MKITITKFSKTLGITGAALLATFAMTTNVQTASAANGMCFYNEAGQSTGRDGCRKDKTITPCSANDPKPKCTVGVKSTCTGNGDYAKVIVIDRTDGFNCPAKY